MPLYFFHVSSNDAVDGFSLRDETEGRGQAKRIAASLGAELPESALPLTSVVTNEEGEKVFKQEISR
jgi:uncharacterized protein DUF6894